MSQGTNDIASPRAIPGHHLSLPDERCLRRNRGLPCRKSSPVNETFSKGIWTIEMSTAHLERMFQTHAAHPDPFGSAPGIVLDDRRIRKERNW